MFFAERLKAARMRKGCSQERLGELASIPGKAIAKYEIGMILPSIENLKKLATALEISTDFFIFDHAAMDGVPRIKDPILFEKYFVLEELEGDERKAALTLLDSLIARQKLRKLSGQYAS